MSKQIPDNAEFFISLCKTDEHSFLTLGAVDPATMETHTLCYLGKKIRNNADYNCSGRLKTFFKGVDGVLTTDYRFGKAKHKNAQADFEYKAFNISRENYLEFLASVKSTVQGKYQGFTEQEKERYKIIAYIPDEEDANQFNLEEIENFAFDQGDQQAQQLDFDIETLRGIGNNCRHTAVELLTKFMDHGQDMAIGLKNNAMQKLPYQAIYHDDKILAPFFILPTPPSKEEMSKQQYKTLKNLYQRLESIPKKYQDSEQTMEKFSALKQLYNSLLPTEAQNLSLSQMLQTIQAWEGDQTALIDTHRKRGFFKPKKTSTRRLINRMANSLQKQVNALAS